MDYWTDLITCVYKCHMFVINKTKSRSDQFQLFMTIRNERISPIEKGKNKTLTLENISVPQ